MTPTTETETLPAEFELESVNGPRVLYREDVTSEELDAACPDGWAVDYATPHVRISRTVWHPDGRTLHYLAAPLRGPRTYRCSDANGEAMIDAASPEAAAQAYVDGSDWGERDRTWWLVVRVEDPGDPDNVTHHRVTIDPPDPPCPHDGGHDWEQTHVQGSGGGVLVTERCRHCGVERATDTWAQDPSDGTQGLRSITYVTPEVEDSW